MMTELAIVYEVPVLPAWRNLDCLRLLTHQWVTLCTGQGSVTCPHDEAPTTQQAPTYNANSAAFEQAPRHFSTYEAESEHEAERTDMIDEVCSFRDLYIVKTIGGIMLISHNPSPGLLFLRSTRKSFISTYFSSI